MTGQASETGDNGVHGVDGFSALSAQAAGVAALSVCESLVLAIVEKGVLSVDEIRGALEDAAAAHRRTARVSGNRDVNAEAVRFIDRINKTLSSVPGRRAHDPG